MTITDTTARYAGREKPPRTEKVPFQNLEWYFDCTVDSAGPGEDLVVWVQLSCPGSFDRAWFTALSDSGDRVLATALAAIQGGLRCTVGVTGVKDGEIYRIHPVAVPVAADSAG
jgi:hypothetical protein